MALIHVDLEEITHRGDFFSLGQISLHTGRISYTRAPRTYFLHRKTFVLMQHSKVADKSLACKAKPNLSLKKSRELRQSPFPAKKFNDYLLTMQSRSKAPRTLDYS